LVEWVDDVRRRIWVNWARQRPWGKEPERDATVTFAVGGFLGEYVHQAEVKISVSSGSASFDRAATIAIVTARFPKTTPSTRSRIEVTFRPRLLDSESATRALHVLLADGSAEIRALAARTIGEACMTDEELHEELQRASKGNDSAVRSAAEAALRDLATCRLGI
jgi:hypothetical protein